MRDLCAIQGDERYGEVVMSRERQMFVNLPSGGGQRKIWVDGRNGNVPKIRPNVYRAIIAEAQGNGMEVLGHISRKEVDRKALRARFMATGGKQ